MPDKNLKQNPNTKPRYGEAIEFFRCNFSINEGKDAPLPPGIIAIVTMDKVQEGDILNGNDRVYPWTDLRATNVALQAHLEARDVIMAYGHPSWGNDEIDRATAVITSIFIDDSQRIIGPVTAEIADTHYGRELLARLKARMYTGVSSRSYGDLIWKDVQLKDGTVVQADVMTNLEMITYDFVSNQSVPGASVSGFRECVEGRGGRNNKGDKNMTLEELRAKYADLVKALQDEARNEGMMATKAEAQKTLDANLPAAVEAAITAKLEAGEFVPASAVSELVKILEGLGYTKNGEPFQNNKSEGESKDTTSSPTESTSEQSETSEADLTALEAERKARKELEARIAEQDKAIVEAVTAQKKAEAEACLLKLLPAVPAIVEAWVREDGFATKEEVEALIAKHAARAKALMGQSGEAAHGKVVLDPARGDEGMKDQADKGSAGEDGDNADSDAPEVIDPMLRMAAGRAITQNSNTTKK